MRGIRVQVAAAVLMAAAAISATGQNLPSNENSTQASAQSPVLRPALSPAQNPAVPTTPAQNPPLAVPVPVRQPAGIPAQISKTTAQEAAVSPAVERLLAFQESEIKFDVEQLMDLLRDKRHEGWVLTAYPDPKTAQPLIGAGFSLDLPAREHPQRDPLNPNQFLEPSSAELWQAAGLAPEHLQTILSEFHTRLDALSKHGFRVEMRTMEPQITPADANALLRVGIIQAAINAKAYSRYFDELTASQQMAMTQLVYQMGVNLEEFTTFLGLINRQSTDELGNTVTVRPSAEYWHDVQKSLEQSQWGRLYRDRATAVIAMFDPHYEANSFGAERKVSAVLRPPRRHGRGARGGALRRAGLRQRHGTAASRRAARRRRD
jgi:hypothetical protein